MKAFKIILYLFLFCFVIIGIFIPREFQVQETGISILLGFIIYGIVQILKILGFLYKEDKS